MAIGTGLVGFWETKGAPATLQDSEGSYDMTQNGSFSVVNSMRGQAAQQDDSSAYYTAAADNTIIQASALCVSFWFRKNGWDATYSQDVVAVAKADGSKSKFQVKVNGELGVLGDIRGVVAVGTSEADSNPTWTWKGGGGGFLDRDWHHVVASYDHATKKIIIAHDGVILLSTTITMASWDENAGMIVGLYCKPYSNPTYTGSGALDLVGLWTRELRPDEIEALYNDGKGLKYMQMDGTSGKKPKKPKNDKIKKLKKR